MSTPSAPEGLEVPKPQATRRSTSRRSLLHQMRFTRRGATFCVFTWCIISLHDHTMLTPLQPFNQCSVNPVMDYWGYQHQEVLSYAALLMQFHQEERFSHLRA